MPTADVVWASLQPTGVWLVVPAAVVWASLCYTLQPTGVWLVVTAVVVWASLQPTGVWLGPVVLKWASASVEGKWRWMGQCTAEYRPRTTHMHFQRAVLYRQELRLVLVRMMMMRMMMMWPSGVCRVRNERLKPG